MRVAGGDAGTVGPEDAEGKPVQVGEMLQRLDAAGRPAPFLAVDVRRDLGHVLGRALHPRFGRPGHARVQAAVREQRRKTDGEHGDADERDREPRPQPDPCERAHRLASR